MFFHGTIHRTLDPKGRFMLPVEFRDVLAQWSPGGSCVLTTEDKCIIARSWSDWEIRKPKLEDWLDDDLSPEKRNKARIGLSGMERLQLDPQNRVRLSRAHMEYAGLKREVLLIGLMKRFEIWDVERFRQIQNQDFSGVG